MTHTPDASWVAFLVEVLRSWSIAARAELATWLRVQPNERLQSFAIAIDPGTDAATEIAA